ncbi:MFS transporter [Clostridium sp. E02]|uniref:MFS transporter n=1 Tax=Clostridium sp. E02 TaxID=2487134 RepID=UPI000F546DFC|nr:MFS transporter [Clostridium sp. E02]
MEKVSGKEKWKKRIGYGIGDLGCNLVFSTMASYLMIFYTDVFGISAAVAGTLMLVTKFIDALTDTGMGVLVDRTHTRWGQGRPYFIIGAIPFAVFTILTFFIPDFSVNGKIIWAYVTYCLLCTAYTVVNIPLNTIVPRLTSDIHERNCLVSSRMICAMIGTAIVMSITAPMVGFWGKGDDAKGYLITMTIYGFAAMIIFIITFFNTKEVVPPSVKREKSSLKQDLKGLTGQSVIFFFVNFLYFGLYVIRNTTVIYYFTYNLQKTEWLTFVGIFGILSGLPMLLVLPLLEKKLKKKYVMYLSAAIYVVGDLLIYFGKNSAVYLVVGLAVTGLGIYGIFGTTFSIQPDVIDYSEYKKNKSVSGLIAAFQGFFVKASMGLASAVIGWVLKFGGYAANETQTTKALFYIETSFIWIPLVLCVLIVIIMSFYKLDDERKDMDVELEKRRKNNEVQSLSFS